MLLISMARLLLSLCHFLDRKKIKIHIWKAELNGPPISEFISRIQSYIKREKKKYNSRKKNMLKAIIEKQIFDTHTENNLIIQGI
jgi:hypothetical protein